MQEWWLNDLKHVCNKVTSFDTKRKIFLIKKTCSTLFWQPTWHSNEKLDSIAMSMERQLGLRHVAERHKRLRGQRLTPG